MRPPGVPTCGCHRGPNVERGKWYGVRSHLHLFYEDRSGTSLAKQLGEPRAAPAERGCASVVRKVTVSAGMLLLLIGAAALATGYVLPMKLEGVGVAEFMVLDQQAVEYNHALRLCRAVGLVLCVLAGALLLLCALSSGLHRMSKQAEAEEEGTLLNPALREDPPGQRGCSATAAPVPFRAPAWVQRVQPEREP